ncbi:Hypothetical protein PBC10988_6120 [Planctomycetales bacterium 10988]|nr:Hypothetical protein PBC10988_6120 [Planctomycetales bacterium 10988]
MKLIQRSIKLVVMIGCLLPCAMQKQAVNAQEMGYSHPSHPPRVRHPVVPHPRSYQQVGTIRGWVFRQYAGSVEMKTKTPYPKDFAGRYYYTPWHPDWVRAPGKPLPPSGPFYHDPRFAPSEPQLYFPEIHSQQLPTPETPTSQRRVVIEE